MRRFARRPSPAMAVAFIALLAALSGTAVALPGKNTVDSGDIKKGAVKRSDLGKNAVTSLKVKNSSLLAEDFAPGQLPQGAQGPQGPVGPQGPQGPPGPVDTSALVKKVAESGETLTGEVGVRFAANQGFDIVSGSYQSRLPDGTPAPTLDIVAGAPTAQCPGIGQSTSGRLCVYVYNSLNFNANFEVLVGPGGQNRLYGWSMEVEITNDASAGFMAASWAYRVP
jgi:hypothetical protein